MVLNAAENELFEREVTCTVDGIKIGVLHDDEADDYYASLVRLHKNDMQLVVPCLVTDSNITYRPVPRQSLRNWVDEQTAKTNKPERPEAIEEAASSIVEPVDAKVLQQVQSRVIRTILKLVSQSWFSPLDMNIIDRFAYGLYWHEENTVDGLIGTKQANALVLVTYALHRTSSPSISYGRTVTVCGKEMPVVVIEDLELIGIIIASSYSTKEMAASIMSGSSIAPK